MKRATSDTGTVHLYSDMAVLRHVGESSNGAAQSLCGTSQTNGPFTHIGGDLSNLDDLCENCQRAVEDEDDE